VFVYEVLDFGDSCRVGGCTTVVPPEDFDFVEGNVGTATDEPAVIETVMFAASGIVAGLRNRHEGHVSFYSQWSAW